MFPAEIVWGGEDVQLSRAFCPHPRPGARVQRRRGAGPVAAPHHGGARARPSRCRRLAEYVEL